MLHLEDGPVAFEEDLAGRGRHLSIWRVLVGLVGLFNLMGLGIIDGDDVAGLDD